MKIANALNAGIRPAEDRNADSFHFHTLNKRCLTHTILICTMLSLFLLAGCSTFSMGKKAADPMDSNTTGTSVSESDSPNGEDSIGTSVSSSAPGYANSLIGTDVYRRRDTSQSPPFLLDGEIEAFGQHQPTVGKSSAQLAEDIAGDTVAEEPPPEKDGQGMLDEALVFCQLSQELWQKGELEDALESLDKAYSLILGIDEADDPKLIQQKEDLRYLISKRILEIYASRNIVVNGNHNAIPRVMNRHVEAELKRLTHGGDQSFFQQAYKRSGQYHDFIVAALKAEGLPEELAWVPLIESGFKVKALSKARALGLWQFIPSTGYKFGLKRDQYIDERIDPYKATHAAIAYLKELHQIFGDWTTVLAAYNCGEGRVLHVIRTQNVNYLDNFWDLYERLPRETARYVPKFLATLHILNNPEKYGLNKIEPDLPLAFETVEVNRQVHLKDLVSVTGASLETLKALNPELRYYILPPETYSLRVPPGKGDVLLAKIDTIDITTPPRRAYVWHRVQRGETLSTIARRYRTSVSSIMNANNMRRSNYIVAGKQLKIPQKGYVVAQAAPNNNKRYAVSGTHHVKRGDSLWIIAKRYGTTTKKIMELNHLRSTRLKIGQVLKIPGGEAQTISQDKLTTYYVKRGDSPYSIARRHSMPLESLLRINNLTPRSKIYPGQQLQVQ